MVTTCCTRAPASASFTPRPRARSSSAETVGTALADHYCSFSFRRFASSSFSTSSGCIRFNKSGSTWCPDTDPYLDGVRGLDQLSRGNAEDDAEAEAETDCCQRPTDTDCDCSRTEAFCDCDRKLPITRLLFADPIPLSTMPTGCSLPTPTPEIFCKCTSTSSSSTKPPTSPADHSPNSSNAAPSAASSSQGRMGVSWNRLYLLIILSMYSASTARSGAGTSKP